jgi:hypothetical protein
MSRIDRLKEQFPKYNFSAIDAIKLIDPSNKNTYSEFLLKILSSPDKLSYRLEDQIERLERYTGQPKSVFENSNKFQLCFLIWLMDMFFDTRDLLVLSKFEEYRNLGLIPSVDISNFKSFEDIHRIVNVTDLKKVDKDMEKQIYVVFEDEEWLLLRPLTHKSSMKYGMGTKWCTTQNDSPDYFQRYTGGGILIYSINKKTGLKVGTFYSLDPYNKEFSFWDSKDLRVDSIVSELPYDTLTIIKNEIKNNPKSNRDLLDLTTQITEDLYYNKFQNKLRAVEPDTIFIREDIQTELPVSNETLSYTINCTYDMFGNEIIPDTTDISW